MAFWQEVGGVNENLTLAWIHPGELFGQFLEIGFEKDRKEKGVWGDIFPRDGIMFLHKWLQEYLGRFP